MSRLLPRLTNRACWRNSFDCRSPMSSSWWSAVVRGSAFRKSKSSGNGAPLDWDNSDLTDVLCRHADARMDYTWRNDGSAYPPGRLDYMIVSDAVMTVQKSFTLRTEEMSAARLAQ